jgi:hypothetical protein
MPQEIISKFQKQYGKKKGKQVYYATANKQGRNPETFKKESFDRRLDAVLEMFGSNVMDATNRLERIELGERVGTKILINVTTNDGNNFQFPINNDSWANIAKQIEEELLRRGYRHEEIITAPSRR